MYNCEESSTNQSIWEIGSENSNSVYVIGDKDDIYNFNKKKSVVIKKFIYLLDVERNTDNKIWIKIYQVAIDLLLYYT